MYSIFQKYSCCPASVVEYFDHLQQEKVEYPLPAGVAASSEWPVPTDLAELPDFFRRERYLNNSISRNAGGLSLKSLLRESYYLLRPLFPVGVRKHMQRLALRGWQDIEFPSWPVDTTVDDLFNSIWVELLRVSGEDRLPFIWYWPEGFRCCGIMTHDVETGTGRDFCGRLMEMEQSFGIVSSFEIVPEDRYEVSPDFLDSIRDGGCEVCLHGLNHDGNLFSEEGEFRRRAEVINRYLQEFGARGFRSPIMYRQMDWLNCLDIAYDMSVPNSARLDPQHGGCCTVMPYFIDDVLELPLTTIQDYSLYNIVGEYSLRIWREQLEILRRRNGLASFIIHPDYTLPSRAQKLYQELLELLACQREDESMWLPLPGEVDRWWRQRNAMELAMIDGKWTISGDGAEKARLAWVSLYRGELQIEVDEQEGSQA